MKKEQFVKLPLPQVSEPVGILRYPAHLPVRLLVQLSARGLELCLAVFSVALSEPPQEALRVTLWVKWSTKI